MALRAKNRQQRRNGIFGLEGAVTGLGDLNGDGKADFAVGAALADRVYVYVSQ